MNNQSTHPPFRSMMLLGLYICSEKIHTHIYKIYKTFNKHLYKYGQKINMINADNLYSEITKHLVQPIYQDLDTQAHIKITNSFRFLNFKICINMESRIIDNNLSAALKEEMYYYIAKFEYSFSADIIEILSVQEEFVCSNGDCDYVRGRISW